MIQPAVKPATYADLVAVPDHLVAEIVGGRLVTRHHLPPRQSVAQSSLLCMLDQSLGQQRSHASSWIFLSRPELHLGAHVVVPEIAGWRRERLPYLPEAPWMELMPDWICEVISPSSIASDHDDKRHIYATHGLRHYWLLDPAARCIETFDLDVGQCVLRDVFTKDMNIVAFPFADTTFELADLWSFDRATLQKPANS